MLCTASEIFLAGVGRNQTNDRRSYLSSQAPGDFRGRWYLFPSGTLAGKRKLATEETYSSLLWVKRVVEAGQGETLVWSLSADLFSESLHCSC